jgi:aromatic-L-amino-acid decarboxylase
LSDITPEEFRRLGHQLIDWVAEHRTQLPSRPVRPNHEPGSIRRQLAGPLPQHPSPAIVDELIALLDDVVVPGSLQWQHPGFYGYFPANATLLSLLGDIASGAIGSQGMMWSTAPAGTELEQALLDALAHEFGLGAAFTFDGGGGGVLQDSASSATLAALLAALHRGNPQWRDTGVTGRERIYVSAETHSSVAKGARVAGLGSRALRVVPNAEGTLAMSSSALARMLDEDISAGLLPVFVCATVGTTGTGAVDPVREIAEVARAHRAWVHVDAAWAGVAALCPEFRGVVDGVDLVDSFCADAHKWLYTAFDASFLWVRDAAALPAALSIAPEYLRNAATESGAVVDYRDWQVPLGRRLKALKVWSVVHGAGLEGLRTTIRGHVSMAADLAAAVEAAPGFVLSAPRSLALVCFHVVDADGRPDDDLSRAVMAAVNDRGPYFLSHTTIDGHYGIRVAIGTPSTSADDVRALWAAVVEARDELTLSRGRTS